MNRIASWIVFGLLFGMSAGLSAFVTLKHTAYELAVRDQPVGTSIFVDRLVLARAGYIAITPQSYGNGHVTPSVSDYMPAGVYTDFNVDIYWGEELDLSAGTRVSVRILLDNGDVYYDPEFDMPALDRQGRVYEKTVTLR